MQTISDVLGWILEKIVQFATYVKDLYLQVFKDAWEMLTDTWVWVFDQMLSVAVSALGSLDLSGITQHTNAWGSLPSEVLEVTSALGLGSALAVIGAAILIRMLLQLVPFTRLGS